MQKIKGDKALRLQVLVSGMHLSSEFGLTYKEIEKDGFHINKKVNISLDSDTAVGVCKSTGLGIIKFSEAYMQLKPDMIAILGDRFEAFAAATAAMISRIPIAHLNGGEATFGLIDEPIRHSITKMSYLHFTSTQRYRKKVIQLGESPKRVFNVGALGLDNIKGLKLLSKDILEKKLNFKFNEHNLLVTFHPVTLENNTAKEQFQNLLTVLDELKYTNIIFTKANADIGGRIINRMIDRYFLKHPYKCIVFNSMGYLKYLSAMKFVDGVVGNSSSGIIETPSFKIGTIDIGDRQKGRIKAKSVIGCEPTREGIRKAIKKLYSEDFQKVLKGVINPHGDGKTAKRIVKALKKADILSTRKKFYNINF
jgi:GDP/UDP-N,N'-diacetylbacillosamine 2-epimerase (hydrolysing)